MKLFKRRQKGQSAAEFTTCLAAGALMTAPAADIISALGCYGAGGFLHFGFTEEISQRSQQDGNSGLVASQVDQNLTSPPYNTFNIPQSNITHSVSYNDGTSLDAGSSSGQANQPSSGVAAAGNPAASTRPTVTCQTQVTFAPLINLGNLVPINVPGLNSQVTFGYCSTITRENTQNDDSAN